MRSCHLHDLLGDDIPARLAHKHALGRHDPVAVLRLVFVEVVIENRDKRLLLLAERVELENGFN